MKPAEVSTPSDREVLVKRSFDAPVKLVWQAYTDPALMPIIVPMVNDFLDPKPQKQGK